VGREWVGECEMYWEMRERRKERRRTQIQERDNETKSGVGEGDDLLSIEEEESILSSNPSGYPGWVSKCHLNNTFDIDFEDGTKERGVRRSRIR